MGYGISKPVAAACINREDFAACRSLAQDDSAYEIRKSCSSDSDSPMVGASRSHSPTLIIFDWDDTLLCTTAINARCWIEGQLQQLERTVESLLRQAMSLGDTIIVTNGKPMWVKESCRHFFPSLLPLLDQISVISARAQFEHIFPTNPFAWKRHTFRKILQCRHRQVPDDFGLNLIVLGDSQAEIEAAHSAMEVVRGRSAQVKTVKFRAAPSCAQLVGQLRKVRTDFEKLVLEVRSANRVLTPRDASEISWRSPSEAASWKLVTSKAAGSTWPKALRPSTFGQGAPKEDMAKRASDKNPDYGATLVGRMPVVRVML